MNLHELESGTSIFADVTRTSNGNMSRYIRFFITSENEKIEITQEVADSLKTRMNRKYGLLTHGVGMDMAFHRVYSLGRMLHNDGYYFDYRQL